MFYSNTDSMYLKDNFARHMMKRTVKMPVKRVETDRSDYQQVYGYYPTQEFAACSVSLLTATSLIV